MKFAYTKLVPRTQPRPYLKVFLRNARNKYYTSNQVMALVDSGADFPIFPMEIATDYLKLDLSKAESRKFSGTTGIPQIAYLADVSITVLDETGTNIGLEILARCGFCDNFQMSGGALLGQIGFFSCFKTTFHQPDQYFEIDQIIETVA